MASQPHRLLVGKAKWLQAAKAEEGCEVARKKKIPSIDYSIKLIRDRIYSDLGGDINKLAAAVSAFNKRLTSLERKVARLRQEEQWALIRGEIGISPDGTRKRVSPERAQKFILDRLRKADGDFVPSRELGGPLGVGRATVATRIRELIASGYNITSSPRKGYALKE